MGTTVRSIAPATKDLAAVLLEDSAGIQENDIKFENKRRSLTGLPYLKAFVYNGRSARSRSIF